MIHCVSLPPYWGRPGYSQTELPYHSGVVTIRNSTVETDLSLGNQVQYPADAAAYIQHHKGSVILVKSCNAEILVENSQLIPDPKGTNGILHTVINSDIAFSVKVPDGTVYPGIRATLKNDKLTGDVIHEDYQRDLYLTLEGTEWSGKLYTGTVDSWRVSAEQEGFACFTCPGRVSDRPWIPCGVDRRRNLECDGGEQSERIDDFRGCSNPGRPWKSGNDCRRRSHGDSGWSLLRQHCAQNIS